MIGTEFTVADVILDQMGGQRLIAMTGVKHFMDMGDGIKMSLPKNKSKANRLYIKLEADDTYTMRFYKFRQGRFDIKKACYIPEKEVEVKTIEGVFCDELQSHFQRVTGMFTYL